MYLNFLEEREKKAFLEIAYNIAYSDGSFNENEAIVIGSYCNEMGIENPQFVNKREIREIAEEIVNAQSKKIVILELMSLVNADNNFDDHERNMLHELIEIFSIEQQFIAEAENWSRTLLETIEKGLFLIDN
jgi:uncharacterized tellurite resistance protein B-like protein